MLVPIVCNCGLPIGDVAVIFRILRAKRVQAALDARGTTPSHATIDSGLRVECADIFDRLGIVHDCCRAHLGSALVFSDWD